MFATATLRATLFVGAAASFAACGHSTIRVVGVMQQSSEMRPLPNVALGGYQQLHLFVRAAPGQSASKYGSPDCGFAPLEAHGRRAGSQQRGVRAGRDAEHGDRHRSRASALAVRHRRRAGGVGPVRLQGRGLGHRRGVLAQGAIRTLAKAVAKLSFTLHDEASGKTLTSSIDPKAAAAAFETVVKNCTMRDGSWSAFSATSREPMTPDFDVLALLRATWSTTPSAATTSPTSSGTRAHPVPKGSRCGSVGCSRAYGGSCVFALAVSRSLRFACPSAGRSLATSAGAARVVRRARRAGLVATVKTLIARREPHA